MKLLDKNTKFIIKLNQTFNNLQHNMIFVIYIICQTFSSFN